MPFNDTTSVSSAGGPGTPGLATVCELHVIAVVPMSNICVSVIDVRHFGGGGHEMLNVAKKVYNDYGMHPSLHMRGKL